MSDALWLYHDRDVDDKKLSEFIKKMKMEKHLEYMLELVEQHSAEAGVSNFLDEFKSKFGRLVDK